MCFNSSFEFFTILERFTDNSYELYKRMRHSVRFFLCKPFTSDHQRFTVYICEILALYESSPPSWTGLRRQLIWQNPITRCKRSPIVWEKTGPEQHLNKLLCASPLYLNSVFFCSLLNKKKQRLSNLKYKSG